MRLDEIAARLDHANGETFSETESYWIDATSHLYAIVRKFVEAGEALTNRIEAEGGKGFESLRAVIAEAKE